MNQKIIRIYINTFEDAIEICDRLRPIASKVKIPNIYFWQDGIKNILITINYKKPTICVEILKNNGKVRDK